MGKKDETKHLHRTNRTQVIATKFVQDQLKSQQQIRQLTKKKCLVYHLLEVLVSSSLESDVHFVEEEEVEKRLYEDEPA